MNNSKVKKADFSPFYVDLIYEEPSYNVKLSNMHTKNSTPLQSSHLLSAMWWLQAHGWYRPLQKHRLKWASYNTKKYKNKRLLKHLSRAKTSLKCCFMLFCSISAQVWAIKQLHSHVSEWNHSHMHYWPQSYRFERPWWLFSLTQMEGGIPQTVSLVGVSAVAQQQLHYRQKKKRKRFNCLIVDLDLNVTDSKM